MTCGDGTCRACSTRTAPSCRNSAPRSRVPVLPRSARSPRSNWGRRMWGTRTRTSRVYALLLAAGTAIEFRCSTGAEDSGTTTSGSRPPARRRRVGLPLQGHAGDLRVRTTGASRDHLLGRRAVPRPRLRPGAPSSSLQFSEAWESALTRLAHASLDYLFLTRVPIIVEHPSFVVLQRTHGLRFDTEYLSWVFNKHALLESQPMRASTSCASSSWDSDRMSWVRRKPTRRGRFSFARTRRRAPDPAQSASPSTPIGFFTVTDTNSSSAWSHW